MAAQSEPHLPHTPWHFTSVQKTQLSCRHCSQLLPIRSSTRRHTPRHGFPSAVTSVCLTKATQASRKHATCVPSRVEWSHSALGRKHRVYSVLLRSWTKTTQITMVSIIQDKLPRLKGLRFWVPWLYKHQAVCNKPNKRMEIRGIMLNEHVTAGCTLRSPRRSRGSATKGSLTQTGPTTRGSAPRWTTSARRSTSWARSLTYCRRAQSSTRQSDPPPALNFNTFWCRK